METKNLILTLALSLFASAAVAQPVPPAPSFEEAFAAAARAEGPVRPSGTDSRSIAAEGRTAPAPDHGWKEFAGAEWLQFVSAGVEALRDTRGKVRVPVGSLTSLGVSY